MAVPVPVPAGGDPTIQQVPPRQPGGQLLRAEEAVVAFKSWGGGFQRVCLEQSEPSSVCKAVLTRSGAALLEMTASDCRCR